MKKTAGISLLLTALVVATYLAMNHGAIEQSVKWWLFGCHLLLAVAGLLTGLAAMIVRQWWGTIALVSCGFFLWIQLVGRIF